MSSSSAITILAFSLSSLVAVGCISVQTSRTVQAPAQTPAAGPISYDVELNSTFDAAVDRVIAAVKKEGFGVISRIDLHTTFKKKIGVDMAPHTILGVCNPKLAHKAVMALPEAALMLPCNVTVQELGANRVMVRIINPESVMAGAGIDSNPAVKAVGSDANVRLKRVAAALAQ